MLGTDRTESVEADGGSKELPSLTSDMELPAHPLRPSNRNTKQHSDPPTIIGPLADTKEQEAPRLEFRTLNPEINWSLDETPGLVDYSQWTLRFDNWGVELDYLRYYHNHLWWFAPFVACLLVVVLSFRILMSIDELSGDTMLYVVTAMLLLSFFVFLGDIAVHCLQGHSILAQQREALLSEYLTTVGLAVLSCLTMAYHWNMEKCVEVSSSDFVKSESESAMRAACTNTFPPLITFATFLWGCLCRPRTFLAVPSRVLLVLMFVFGRIGRPVDSTDMFIVKMSFTFICAVVSIVLSAWNEISQRQHFMESVRLYSETVAIRKRQKALDMRLLKLVPPQLYDRLVDEVGMLDVSQNACVIVCQVDEFPNWCSRLMPHIAAVTIGDLLSAVDQIAKKCHVERIKNLGDMIVVSSNLLGKCSNPVDRICSFAQALQSSITHFNSINAAPIPLLSAVHSGHLIGAVVGTIHVRYDCFGEAMTECIKLIPFCEPYETLISQQAYRALQMPNLIIVEPRELPSSGDEKRKEVYIFRGRVPGANNIQLHPSPENSIAEQQPIAEVNATEDNSENKAVELSPAAAQLRLRMQRGRSASVSIEGIIHKLNEIVEGTELKVECLELHFVSPTMEDEYFKKWEHRPHDWRAAIVAFALLSVHQICIMAAFQLPHFSFAIAYQCVALLLIVVGQAIFSFFPKHITICKIVAVLLSVAAILFTFASASVTRPSILANDLQYLLGFMMLLPFVLGLHLNFSTQLLSVVYWAVLVFALLGSTFLYRATVRIQALFGGILIACTMPVCFLYKAGLHRTLYRDQLRSEQLLKVSEVQSELRQALIDSTIPQQVLRLIEGTHILAGNRAPNLTRSQIVSGTETIVLLLQFCELERVCNSATRTAALDPAEFLKMIDAVLQQAEEAVKKWCKNLAIVRMAGDTVMLSAPTSEESCLPQTYLEAISVILELRQNGVLFSAVITVDPAFAVIGQGEFPTFDLLGPATYYARSIMAAMPCPNVIVLTEHVGILHTFTVEQLAKQITPVTEEHSILSSPPALSERSETINLSPSTINNESSSIASLRPNSPQSLRTMTEKSFSMPSSVSLTAHSDVHMTQLAAVQLWKIRGLGVARVHFLEIK